MLFKTTIHIINKQVLNKYVSRSMCKAQNQESCDLAKSRDSTMR